MEEYVIGAGALLQAGPAATATPATLHAQADAAIAGCIQAALVDFEGAQLDDRSRLLILAPGFTPQRFNDAVVSPLLAQRECSLADVLVTTAHAACATEVHIFARWLPDEALIAALDAHAISVVAHPLETISQAALVTGQSYRRWRSPLRAA